MLANSIDHSNQLKLNLDALVSNLNLVNIIQEPRPIVIENVNNNRFFVQNGPTNSSFNFIDENKLKMFSFLAERKLKEKEWHAKYFVENQPTTKKPAVSSKDLNKNKNDLKSNNKKRSETPTEVKNKIVEHKAPVDWALKVIPLDVKLTEMKVVSKHMMAAIEHLEKVLNEFREKQLKVDCIDEQEEIKQAKIHNEQIKNASRLLYNFQNQLRQLELDLSKPDKVMNENQKVQAISRLMNTQRYIVKSIENLNNTYPYRNDNSNKLYKNLFKHLYASCEVFSRNVYVLNLDPDGIIRALNQKMFACCKIIEESCAENDVVENNNEIIKKKVKNLAVPSKIKSRVVEKPAKKVTEVKKAIAKPKEVKKIKHNPVTKEIFNSSLREETIEKDEDRPILLKKTVQTGRMFPSTRVKSAIPASSRSNSREAIQIPNQRSNLQRPRSFDGERTFTYASPRSPRKVDFAPGSYRLANNNNNNNNSNNNSLNDSNYMQYDIHAYNKPSRFNIQRENDVEMFELHNKYKGLQHYRNNMQKQQEKLKQIDSSFNFDQSFNSNVSPLRSYKPKSIISDYNAINQLYTKMNQMKDESDSIKRKYEMLKYSNEGIINKKTIPYAECYVKVEEPKLNNQNLMIYPVDDEYSKLKTVQRDDQQVSNALHGRVHHQINKPKNQQIDSILEYKRKFSNYSKRNSYLSNSEINEGKLFERLSEDIFDDYFTGICREIESLNNDLADNLLNAELTK